MQVYTTSNSRGHVFVRRLVRGGGHGVPQQHQQARAAAAVPALGSVLLLWPRSAGAGLRGGTQSSLLGQVTALMVERLPDCTIM